MSLSLSNMFNTSRNWLYSYVGAGHLPFVTEAPLSDQSLGQSQLHHSHSYECMSGIEEAAQVDVPMAIPVGSQTKLSAQSFLEVLKMNVSNFHPLVYLIFPPTFISVLLQTCVDLYRQ